MYKLSVRVEKDGRQVGASALDLDERKYRDERQALEALHQKAGEEAGRAVSQAYEAAGIVQFPQGGGEDTGARE